MLNRLLGDYFASDGAKKIIALQDELSTVKQELEETKLKLQIALETKRDLLKACAELGQINHILKEEVISNTQVEEVEGVK